MAPSIRPARLLAPIAVAIALAAAAPPASAGLLVSTATSCDSAVLEQPFRRWLDYSSYTLLRNGGFEAGSKNWTLSSASVASGNETFYVHGSRDRYSLLVKPGGSATSSSICVGLDRPTLRFLAVSKGGTALSTLAVDVLFEDSTGAVRSLQTGVVTVRSKWAPTLPMPVVASLLPLLPGSRTAVAFRFRSVGGAEWRVDDVYVDPRSRR
ncbi:MAG TPA: hypothetical protein VF520_01770 [Thermoleophilaceae bacterium]|jgi:hypothetical protein